MNFFTVVLTIIFAAILFGLTRRVAKLETDVARLRNNAWVESSVSPLSVSPLSVNSPTPTVVESTDDLVSILEPRPIPIPVPLPRYEQATFTPQQVASVPSEFFLYTWFKEHTLIKIGGVFFFLGAVWFVSYAISLGWISPEVRILFGFLLATLTAALGYYRKQFSPEQYVILTAVGVGILSATVAAAQLVFAMLLPVVALFLLAGGLAYTTYVALETKTNWLVIVSTVTALLVPQLVGTYTDSTLVLMYLVLMSGGLLTAALLLNVRMAAMILAFGVLFYELRFLPESIANVLWFFVVLLAGVIFAGVSALLARTDTVSPADITALFVTGIGFIFFASKIALSATLALFIATFVIGLTGYVFAERRAALPVVSLYVALASIGLLVATSFLFSGFTLILAYIIESTCAFLLVTHLGLPSRVIYMVTLTYLLPLLGSLSYFDSQAWDTGVWHADALVAYSMSASLVISTLWLLHNKVVAVYTWSRCLALTFGVASLLYAYALCGVFTHALFALPDATVMMYIMWAMISLVTLYYTLRQTVPLTVSLSAALSVLIPVLASLPSFASDAWILGIKHIEGYGVVTIFMVLVLITLLLLQRLCKEYDRTLLTTITGFVIGSVMYLFTIFHVLWNGLLSPDNATVASYVSYAIVLYCLIAFFSFLRVGASWIVGVLAAFILPIMMSFSSFKLGGYTEGPLTPEVVGLFSMVVLMSMIALGLRNRYQAGNEEDDRLIKKCIRGLFGLVLLYATLLTWSLAHTLVAADQAVSVALFIYTVSGLLAYHVGKQYQKADWRFAGSALLVVVVARLLLVDVWEMDLLYRFITFLGIGALFIGAALLEKRPPTA